ncbi:unnamed protein product [Litomosoides sigmodontis]|uniref:Uncharacterized protein n=1 Tax=Litomosoides sigmodontis TaxID=42156 RepID=A0A3P6UB50_LITSI|nr:unnamed protein product [Litomosoides sigmodontis]
MKATAQRIDLRRTGTGATTSHNVRAAIVSLGISFLKAIYERAFEESEKEKLNIVGPKIFHTWSYGLDIGRSTGRKCSDFLEVKVAYNALLTMDIGTNELTRPFRIPRRRAGEGNTADCVPDKTKRLRLGSQSDLRSPLASTSSIRKHDSAFSSRIVPPTKKKTAQDYQQTSMHPKKSKPGELFDRILDSMVNPPKERRKDTAQDDIDEAGPSGVTANVGSSPPKRSTSGLTREDLQRHQNDDSSCYAFMQREGLMERLLGHKMLTGRVDSHVVLGFLPFDPKDSLPSRNRKNSNSKVDDFPTICEPPLIGVANEERRGPKTPPGSPGHDANSSILSSRGVGSASPSSPPPPPPADETIALSGEDSKLKEETPDLIAEMAELTKLPHNQLAECLGEELQKAMKQVDHKVLLETLKDALLKVGKKNDDQQDGQNQAAFKEDMHMCPVEMDLESNKSVSGNGVLLPPPPPAPLTPPIMVPALPVGIPTTPVVMTPTVLPTPPPPPPLVMLHPGTASQVLVSTSAAGNAPSLYPYFPPPHQLTIDQSINPSTVSGTHTSTTAASVIFAGVPYAPNLAATSSLTVPSLNLSSHASAATAQPTGPNFFSQTLCSRFCLLYIVKYHTLTKRQSFVPFLVIIQISGIVGALQNISTVQSHASATPTASAATPYRNQTPAFALYPGSTSQQLPPTTAGFASNNHYSSTKPTHNSHYGSANIDNNSKNSTVKVNNHPPVILPPTALHPYAGATNYNISGTSMAPYSVPTTSCAVTTSCVSVTTPTVPSLQRQLHQQSAKPLMVPSSSFGCGSHQIGTENSNCNFSELRTSQNPYPSHYQTADYSPPLQHHQHQNPNLPGTPSDGTAGTAGTLGAKHQLQSDEKSFSTNFSRPPLLQMQTSLESLPTSASVAFNGGEISSSRFISSNAMKTESVSITTGTAPGFSSDRSLPGRVVNSTSANFGSSKSSDEPVSVPSSQNVIKTLLSALSIPHSSDSTATGAVPNNSASVPETNDGDQEVDFCWPPANMDARWSHESGSFASEKAKKIGNHPLPLCGKGTNASRMMFFDQPASANSAVLPSRIGATMMRPRLPLPPPIQNRMPLNRLPKGLLGSSQLSALLSSGLRARPPFRPSELAACSPFSSLAVPPLRPRITPPFFTRRQPFPLRPPPPGMRQPRPPFLR